MPNLELVGLELTYNPRGEQQAAAGLRRLLDLADKTEKAYKRLNGVADGNAGKALVAGVKQSIAEQSRLDRQLQTERIRNEKQTSLAVLALKRQETADIARLERQRFAESQRSQRLQLQEAGKNARSAQLASTSRGFAAFGNGVASLSNGVALGGRLAGGLVLAEAAGIAKNLATESVQAAVGFDSLDRALTTAAGSAEEAKRQMAGLEQAAKLPGLGLEQVIRGSITLQAAGINAQLAERSIKGFGNALALAGKGKAELDGVVTALSQIQSKGVVSAEEINQIAERVPQIRQVMIRAFGTANTEILQKAKITSEQFISTIVAELERLPKASASAQNSFDNFDDAVNRLKASAAAPFLPALAGGLDLVSGAIEKQLASFNKLDASAQRVAVVQKAISVGNPILADTIGLAVEEVNLLSSAISGVINVAEAVPGAMQRAFNASGGLFDKARAFLEAISGAEAERKLKEAQKLTQAQDAVRQREAGQIGPRLNALPGRQRLFDPIASLGGISIPEASAAAQAKVAREDAAQKKFAAEQARFNAIGGTGTRAGRGRSVGAAELTEADRLNKQIDELKEASRQLRNETSAEYQLRVKLFNAQETKNELEELFKLRRQFGFDGNLSQLQGLAEFDRIAKSNNKVTLAVEPNEFVVRLLASQAKAADDAAEAIERRNRALDARADIAGSALDLDRERVQTRLTAGLITESQAQREIVALERERRVEIIASLEARKTAAGITQAEIAALDVQIERARQLGLVLNANLTARQSFQKGLFDVPGTFNQDVETLGRDVQGSFRNSISTGIREGGKEGLASFLDGLSGRLADFAADTITRNLFGALGGIGGAKTPGFNPNAQGGSGGGIGGFFGKIGGLFGLGTKTSVNVAGGSNAESNLTLLVNQGTIHTRLLELIAQNTANDVALQQQATNNAAAAASKGGGILSTLASIAGLVGTAAGAAGGLKNPFGQRTTVGFGGGRANGGEVFAGALYETHGLRSGREFFVPSSNGTVINQEQLQAVVAATNRPNAPVINITVNASGNQSGIDARRTADQIASAVRESLTRTERNR